MTAVSWFLQIPPNPRRTNRSSSALSKLAFLLWRSSSPPSGDKTKQLKPSRTVSWNPHVEVLWRSRSVTWTENLEVIIIPARDCAPDDYDLSAGDDEDEERAVCFSG